MEEEKFSITFEDNKLLEKIKNSKWNKFKLSINNKFSNLKKRLIQKRYSFNKQINNAIINKLKDDNQKLKEMISTKNEFFDLCAYDKADEKKCSELLEWGLNNKKVRNIAVTGPYGSGKSSFLKTFENKHKKYHYLNISLASFKDNTNDEKIIEENILQQIIYRKSARKMKNSRISRIKEENKFDFLIKFLFFYFFLNISYIIFPNLFKYQLEKLFLFTPLLSKIDRKIYNLNILTIIYLFFIAYFFFILVSKFKITSIKLTHGRGEVELGNNIETSIFYKHLDEIIYFFKKTKYNVIYFEDIDRFKKIDINLFTKIRELNIILNESHEIKKTIKFIYALKDDLFDKSSNENKEIESFNTSDKMRTKFFDLIIPIIPVINITNAYDVFRQKIINIVGEIGDEFDKNLKAYSYYIDDMRLINNIINEFIIYKENLSKKTEKELRILLGFIVYKNKFPKDFSKLHCDEGLIYNFLSNKFKNLKNEKEKLTTEITLLKENIEMAKREIATTIENLRRIYIGYLYQRFPSATGFNKFLTKELIENKVSFESLLEVKNINYESHYSSSNPTNIPFSQIEDEIGINYREKEKFLIGEESIIKKQETELLEKENILKEFKKNFNKKSSIPKLIKIYGKHLVFSSELLKENLLIYLLENNIIEEKSYKEYISYFYEGRLTRNDSEFIKAIRYNKAKNPDYELSNIKEILNDLSLNDFAKKEVLNFDLIFYLINHKIEYEELLNDIFNSLNQMKAQEFLEFLDKFLHYKQYNPLIYKVFTIKANNFLEKILVLSNYSNQKKIKYFLRVYKNFDIDKLLSFENNNKISNFIENQDNLSALELIYNESTEKCFEFIKNFNLSLLHLKYYKSSELFEYLYKNNHYNISDKNIKNIGEYLLKNSKLDDYNSKNLTTIKNNSELKEIQLYIEENIEIYLKNVFFKIKTNVEESENTLLELLNKNDELIDFETKKIIIEFQNNIYTDITKITDESLWEKIIQEKKINATWKNILNYYVSKENIIDDYLMNLLNKKDFLEELSKFKIKDTDYNESDKINLSNELYINNDISRDNYLIISNSLLPLNPESIEFIVEEKIDLILKTKAIPFDEETLETFINIKPDWILNFIKMNLENFLKNLSNYQDILNDDILLNIFETLSKEDRHNFISNITFKEEYNIDFKIAIENFLISLNTYNEFSKEKVNELNSYNLFPINQYAIDFLKKFYKDEFETYLRNNAEKLIFDLEILVLDEKDYFIIYSEIPNIKKKIQFIEKSNKELWTQDSKFIIEIVKDFSKGNQNLNHSIILLLLSLISKTYEEYKINLINNHLHNLNIEKIKEILISLGDPYIKMTQKQNNNLKYTNYNYKLVEILENSHKEIISSSYIKQDDIIIRIKRSFYK